ncbi:hypothetical protein F5888DRAFT_870031 [Russula emetica]|nr:hypothetical protein F5888DRAFT_870031 [Russula emetica]
MDTEQTCQLFTQSRLRCLVLEADRDAESLRADKYRKILDTVINEGRPDVAESHGQAARASHAARDASPTVTLDPVELTTSQHPSPNPSVVGRKRNSSFTDNPSQISKRARQALNISLASTSTSEPRSPGMLVTRDTNAPVLDVAGMLRNAGLMSPELTRAETICAEETPGISWTLFCNTFGGMKSEWPGCSKESGYEDFLCTIPVAIQPFMPLDTGKPGLVLRLPTVTESSQNDKSTFHVLTTMPQGGALYYRGKYAKIPLPQLQFKWKTLPPRFKERWIRRTLGPAKRALRARIELRNIQKREPAAAEVEEYSKLHFKDHVTFKQVSAAFKSGDEKMIVEGIYCTAYDSQLATIIQRAVQANGD